MSKHQLHISSTLLLPMEAVTQTFAILAKRGVGKTYTASVMAEEMIKAKQQVVIIDPIGVWWGLRAGANGSDEGLEIIVMGGEHGDIPLESTAGETIADFVVESGRCVLLDLSLFRKGEMIRFMEKFSETIYRRNRTPLHLMIDEADTFAPQKVMRGEGAERLLGAMEDIVRRGRARGLGVTLVTQRAAVLNKNVLTQAEVLVCLRTIAPQDLAAAEAWIHVHGTQEERDTLMQSLPSLPIGTAWFWSPGWLDIFQQVKVRKRETFDSSSTPKVGEKIATPKKLAPVNLEELQEKMKATVERAKSNDPVALRKENAELKKTLTALESAQKTAEVPMLTPAQGELLVRLESSLCSLDFGQIQDTLGIIRRHLTAGKLPTVESMRGMVAKPRAAVSSPIHAPVKIATGSTGNGSSGIGSAHQRILRSLFWLKDEPRTPAKVAFFAGYTVNGHFNNVMGNLRSQGLVAGWEITPDGVSQVPSGVEPKPTGAELREWMRPKLNSAENKILDVLIEAQGKRVDVGDLATGAGYTLNGHFNNCLGHMRTIEVAEGGMREGGVKAADVFFE